MQFTVTIPSHVPMWVAFAFGLYLAGAVGAFLLAMVMPNWGNSKEPSTALTVLGAICWPVLLVGILLAAWLD